MFTRSMSRWIVAGAFVLFGTALAAAQDGWRPHLAGTWNNVSSGENIKIERGLIGWEVWSSKNGEGRIIAESDAGANVTIASRAGSCSYYLTMINDNQINMQLREGPDECLKGVFLRVATPKPVAKTVVVIRKVIWRKHHHACGC